ncbi:M16 family metallopeptidase [Chachezhania sediminis]|uniref:M16 family metallopeptidase n=1 Tax=Chachezhania sediminis TaxID=2599291 RepID=UPI00131D9319|nr:pitrilysin family protein [Chachezhania sediminis]
MMRFATWIRAGAVAGFLAAGLALPAGAAVEIEDVTTPAGISAWLVEDHSNPFTVLEIRFRGGTSLDQPDKRGAIYLMMGLLEEGSGDLDSRAHARALESIAASVDYDASDDEVSITATFLTESRDEAMALLHDALHDPHFDPDDIDRVRRQVLSSLASDLQDPNAIAGKTFSAMAFGDHPYGSPGEGTIESVSALTRDDIVAAYDAVFARDRLYVGAVGDITAPELSEIVDGLLADLPETGAPLPGKADFQMTGGVTVVPFETPQSVAIFGQKGLDRDDPDFFAAYVLNQILGSGGFESRLMNEVREKRGLTYGVYSYLVPKDHAAIYMGSVASGNDRIAEAVEVIRDEWRRMAEEGVTQEELDKAKTYLTGAFPLRFDGNGRVASIMVGMQMEGLPVDYIATRNDKVNAVTLDDVNRVARELLDPDGLHFVVVGQPIGMTSTPVPGSEG